MPRIKDSNLGYLGVDFQYKLVKCFIEDQPFFCGIQHIVDQNMFTEDALRRIVGFMKDRYMATEAVATYFDIEALVRSKITDTSTIEIMLATLSTIKEMDLGGMDIVENETEKFFKQQNLTRAINESMEIIKNGNSSDYYVIEDIVKKALETNTRQDYGFRVFDYIDSDLREDYRQPIPTGTKELDASLYGGLGKGELGLIVSPMGVGKALPLTARVLTPNGYTLMGDIKVGDRVIGRDGKPYNVMGVYPQEGKRPVYRVTFSNGTSCECDEEHLWSVSETEDGNYKTMSLKEIMGNSDIKYYIPMCEAVEFDNYFNSNYSESHINLNFALERRRFIVEELLCETEKSVANKKVVRSPNELSEKIFNLFNISENPLELMSSCGINVYFEYKDKEVYIVFDFASKCIGIKSIEYVRDDYTQCIMVDSPDHLYVIEDFIVTHNTSIVTGFAAAAATCQCEANNYNGYKVLHLFHEDPEPAIRRKYFGYVLDIDACTLSDPDVRPYAIQRLKEDDSIKTMITNNIRCKRLSTGEVTASQIKEMIKANIARGFKPDMVIIDYFECLKPEKSQSFNENEWSKEAVTMRKLETICNEFQIALWVPVQGTKGSIGENFVGLQHAGGSVAKTQIGHVILTLARTEEQKAQGLINVYIQKLRAVKIGRDKFLNVRFNNGTCKFDMSDMADENTVAFDNQSSQNMAVARDVVNRQRRNG